MEEIAVRNVSLSAVAGEAAAKKGSEFAVDRILNWIIDNLKAVNGTVRAAFKTGFTRYLENAELRYNQVRTLTTTSSSRSIVGPDSIYVNIGVRHDGRIIDTDTADDMLRISNHILLVGTGGIGKSMLLRYLFINTVHRGTYVPVMLELRKISSLPSENISIEDLIYSCMEDFDVQLPRDEFEYSLRSGRYLFLLDGFDEVKSDMAPAAAEAIQSFCSKYPKNCCIVTSRPREASAPLQTFAVMEAMPLSKEQAVVLASKIWPKDEKTQEFCRQLRDDLYDRHKEFAQNPLLLTMMFLTFMRNNSIPEHLADFYQKAFDALYSDHDNNDKGVYHREFCCKDLDEGSFKKILSHFCFHSYLKEKYEFSEDELISYISKGIDKTGMLAVVAKDYIEDLRKVVCFLVKEGDVYRFAHRSFQAYFAAYYTEKFLTDEQQKRLFEKLLDERPFFSIGDYFELIYQMQADRFAHNAVEMKLREMHAEASEGSDPEWAYVQMLCSTISVHPEESYLTIRINGTYPANIFRLFQHFFGRKDRDTMGETEWDEFRECLLAFLKFNPDDEHPDTVAVQTIKESVNVSEEDRTKLIEGLKCLNSTMGVHEIIAEWLAELELKRALLASDDFFDSL